MVGDGFNPEVGFTRRRDFRRTATGARFSPRPKRNRLIRKMDWEGNYVYITSADRERAQNREAQGIFRIDFENSDVLNTDYTHDYEFLPRDFAIAPRVTVPSGGYTYQNFRTSYTLGMQRRVSGRFTYGRGTLYAGHKDEASFSSGRVKVTNRLNVEPSVTLNWVDLPQGSFTTRLVTTRVIVTPSPRMLISSLVQYNQGAHSVNSSVRLRWEYSPGSEIFLVYSDGWNTLPLPDDSLLNRSLAVKLTRLIRF